MEEENENHEEMKEESPQETQLREPRGRWVRRRPSFQTREPPKQYPTPKSSFLIVRCTACKNEQVIFSKVSTEVKCLVCGSSLASATGGTAALKAKVMGVLD